MTRVVAATDPDAIELAVAALRAGGVIAIPTETVYGLAVLPTEAGIERLLAVKHRSAEKGIQLLIDSVDQVAGLAVMVDSAAALAARFWPGGLTIVVRRRDDVVVPESLGGGRPTLGFRLPDHAVPRALARRLGPIAASSANISGEPDATTAEKVVQSFGDELALIIDDGPVRGGTPSTVVDCSDPATGARVLREGAVGAAAIAEALD